MDQIQQKKRGNKKMSKLCYLSSVLIPFLVINYAYSSNITTQTTKGKNSPAISAPNGTVTVNYDIPKRDEKIITLQTFPIQIYNDKNIDAISNNTGINNYNYNLDDDIITDYYLLRFKINNNGVPIDSPLTFCISTGTKTNKIIDIKYKVNKPKNKTIVIKNSLPNISWKFPESGIKMTFIFENNLDNMKNIIGYNIYKSVFKEIGYGRINSTLITTASYQFIEHASYDLSTVYYKLAFVDKFGGEQQINLIEPQMVQNLAPICFPNNSTENLSTNNSNKVENVFNEMILDSVDLTFSNGIDSNSDIDIYVLCKILPNSELKPDIKLIGSSQIQINLINKIKNYKSKIIQLDIPDIKIKPTLTPVVVKSYSTKDSIYLVWEPNITDSCFGIRIFKSIERKIGDLYNSPGNLIYDGPGLMNLVTLMPIRKEVLNPSSSKELFKMSTNYIQMPRIQNKDCPSLNKPTGLRLSKEIILQSNYYVDSIIDKKQNYTYTIYSYDKMGNTGFPVSINASIADPYVTLN